MNKETPLLDDVAMMAHSLRFHALTPAGLDAAADLIERLARQVPPDCVVVPKSRYKELTDCLEAMATGKGGWAWEDVLDEHRAMIAAGEDNP